MQPIQLYKFKQEKQPPEFNSIFILTFYHFFLDKYHE